MASVDNHSSLYAVVILPTALPQNYTWSVPFSLQDRIRPGHRVEVNLGKSKKYWGIVRSLSTEVPTGFRVKEILRLLDDAPFVTIEMLRLWEWLAAYYLCSEGEILAAAIPAPFRTVQTDALTAVQPKFERFVLLHDKYKSSPLLNELLDNWKGAPRQLALLMAYLEYHQSTGEVAVSILLKRTGATAALLKALLEKGILVICKKQVDRLYYTPSIHAIDFELNVSQQRAFEQIKSSWQQQLVCLLHGVTASGKTHVYIQLISEALLRGEQVLYMLPEIALTAQIVRRLQHCFGGQVGVYHSKFSQQERAELWQKVASGQLKVLLGARSAVFLPFQQLGLIICDEEHDPSFKQQEPSPRYHGRDAAIYLASLVKANVLLGSATPSLETYHQALTGKFGHVTLLERFAPVTLPPLRVIDTRAVPVKKRVGGFLTPALVQAMERVLEAGRQIILFQNRRGYVPYQLCQQCGWIPTCKHCDVSLTMHKQKGQLLCHYCGSSYPIATRCASCGHDAFLQRNFGTELIEEELQKLFPSARIARMDVDAIRGKQAHEHLVRKFEQGQIDILVGTQMVVKGLDVDRVDLVGILDADGLLHFTDFRVHERAFQLMEQVSGRAGRKKQTGEVIVQTSQPTHPVLQFVIAHDYRTFFKEEIAKREEFFYPPFSRLILISFRHASASLSNKAAQVFAQSLVPQYGSNLTGPAPAVVSRVRNQYRTELLLKLPRTTSVLQECKQAIRDQIADLHRQRTFSSVQVVVDVDII
ncbi:MAG: primosomal protein N' [Sphingomonadales bacterium]|nr:primosomal protein N' [Sphingomonadales bacterium]